MSYVSKYNLVLENRVRAGEYLLYNPLSGAVDLADASEIRALEDIVSGSEPEREFIEYLRSRGYVFDSKEEEDELIAFKYKEFQEAMAQSPVQLFLIPTYGCNLACTYCFQEGIKKKKALIDSATIEAFFTSVDKKFGSAPVKPFVTLFGGEPLIDTPNHREAIRQIIAGCNERGYELAVVTNGYDLKEYLDLLGQAAIKEIQVTLDGDRETHDARRFTKGREGTFDKILESLSGAVERGFPINLRTVVDKSNLMGLVKLAELLDAKGWLDLPQERFKTQIGRNYELIDANCSEGLLSQLELWQNVVKLSENYPLLRKFHQPQFKGMKYLVLTGETSLPSFDTCPACKGEWVYDLYGDIYGCTASCGREEYKLGTFYPAEQLDMKQVEQWTGRNVLQMEECRDCPTSLICGGGCGVVAKEKNGRILSPDCRPIKELLELGMEYYREELLKLG